MNTGAILAILGGLIILISGLMEFAAPGGYSVIAWYIAGTSGAALAIICGILTLVGGWWTSKGKTGAILAIIFSLIAFAVGGGWAIGSILGIIGGIMAWMKK